MQWDGIGAIMLNALPDLCVDLIVKSLCSGGSSVHELARTGAALCMTSKSTHRTYGLAVYEHLDPGCSLHGGGGLSMEVKTCLMTKTPMTFAMISDMLGVTQTALFQRMRTVPEFRSVSTKTTRRGSRVYTADVIIARVLPLFKATRLTDADLSTICCEVMRCVERQMSVLRKRCRYLIETQRMYFPENSASDSMHWMTSSSLIYDRFVHGRLTRSDILSHISHLACIYRRHVLVSECVHFQSGFGGDDKHRQDRVQAAANDYIYRGVGTYESTLERLKAISNPQVVLGHGPGAEGGHGHDQGPEQGQQRDDP